jgi:hypothetical protein
VGLLWGCGDDNGTTPTDGGGGGDGGGNDDGGGGGDDAGNGGGDDAGNGGGGGPGDLPALSQLMAVNPSDGSMMPADFSCLGTRTAPPTDGEDATFTLAVETFSDGDPVADTCVEFYPDNQVATDDTCDGMTTDDNGEISVTAPVGSWYGYRVFPNDSVIASVQINEVTPSDGSTTSGTAITPTTANSIPLAAGGRSRAPATVFVAGFLYDCSLDGDTPMPLTGGAIRVARADGTYVAAGSARTDPAYVYFNGNPSNPLPDASRDTTNVDGTYLALNVPIDAAGDEFFIEAWGVTEDGGDPEVVACERVTLFPDGGALVNLGPTRADGPSCPGLAN